MAGDAFRKVTKGGRFKSLPAAAWNAFLDASKYSKANSSNVGGKAVPKDTKNGMVYVRNDTGSTIIQFGIVGLGAPIITPTNNEQEFKRVSVFSGEVPSFADHIGTFAVLAEPLAADAVGLAYIEGIVPVQLYVFDDTYECPAADIEESDGSTEELRAFAHGSARILWREGGTGTQWAIVQLGPKPKTFPVDLTQVSGTAGGPFNQASWTYDVVDYYTGEVLEAAVDPVSAPHEWRRPTVGYMEAADSGYATYDETGQIILGWINEAPVNKAGQSYRAEVVDISNPTKPIIQEVSYGLTPSSPFPRTLVGDPAEAINPPLTVPYVGQQVVVSWDKDGNKIISDRPCLDCACAAKYTGLEKREYHNETPPPPDAITYSEYPTRVGQEWDDYGTEYDKYTWRGWLRMQLPDGWIGRTVTISFTMISDFRYFDYKTHDGDSIHFGTLSTNLGASIPETQAAFDALKNGPFDEELDVQQIDFPPDIPYTVTIRNAIVKADGAVEVGISCDMDVPHIPNENPSNYISFYMEPDSTAIAWDSACLSAWSNILESIDSGQGALIRSWPWQSYLLTGDDDYWQGLAPNVTATNKFLRSVGDGTSPSALSYAQVDWADLSGVPGTFPPSAHAHAASDITSGTLALARGGTNADGSALGVSLFFASPVAGGAASYRAIAAADIPALPYVSPVSPSVVGNFVSFSNITGGQADSGSKAADFAVAAHNHAGVYLPVAGAGDIYTHNAAEFAIAAHTHAGTYLPVAGAGDIYTHNAAEFSVSAHTHAGVYEPVLGNPAVTGYVLVSTDLGVRSWVVLPAAGGAHNILSATHSDAVGAAACVRGDFLYGDAAAKWNRLALGGASGSFIIRNATDPAWSGYYLAGTATKTYTFPIIDDTLAGLGTANAWSVNQSLSRATAAGGAQWSATNTDTSGYGNVSGVNAAGVYSAAIAYGSTYADATLRNWGGLEVGSNASCAGLALCVASVNKPIKAVINGTIVWQVASSAGQLSLPITGSGAGLSLGTATQFDLYQTASAQGRTSGSLQVDLGIGAGVSQQNAGCIQANVGIGAARSCTTAGVMDANVGFRVAGAAAAGTFLRGDGTNYIASVATIVNAFAQYTLPWAGVAANALAASGAIADGDGVQRNNTGLISAPIAQVCNGRLTLTTSVPITTADVTAATTLYFTPYSGNRVSVFDGTRWKIYSFTEVSIALVGLTALRLYDVFLYDNGGTLTLELLIWTNATTRATALVTQDGVLVKSGATTRLYLGTIRIDAAGAKVTDSVVMRNVWNNYNRVSRAITVIEATNSWAYNVAAWRQANAAATNQVAFVIGRSEDAVKVRVICNGANTTAYVTGVGIALDVTNANHAATFNAFSGGISVSVAEYVSCVPVGGHYLAWVEYGAAAAIPTFYGDNGALITQSGMTGVIMA